jgi:hypothetical protein
MNMYHHDYHIMIFNTDGYLFRVEPYLASAKIFDCTIDQGELNVTALFQILSFNFATKL